MLTLLTFKLYKAKALYLFLSFHFKSQINDLALFAEGANQPKLVGSLMLYEPLLGPVIPTSKL
jgi:hypothetical protein